MKPAFVLVALFALAAPVAGHALPALDAAVGHGHAATQKAPPHAHLPHPWALQAQDAALLLQAEDRVQAVALPGTPALYEPRQVAADYMLTFECPSLVESDDAFSSTSCPAHVFDVEDIMSQPVLMVDRKDPEKIAFHAMHGGPGVRLPNQGEPFTAASRDDYLHQPHTVFQSTDGGAFYDDNRYYSPMQFAYPEIFGEDNAAVLDHRGQMHISSLYSYREEGGGPLKFAMFNWHQSDGGIEVAFSPTNNPVRRDPHEPNAAIHELHTVFDRASRSVVNLWLEEHADGRRFIEGDRVDVDEGAWEAMPNEVLLGPCSDMTNPVESGDRVYVGCVAAEGYPLPDGAAHGQLMIHRYEPGTWNHTFVGVAPMPAAAGSVLASAEAWHPRAIAVAGGAIEDGVPSVLASLGIDGKDWTPTAQYGDRLTDRANRNGGLPVGVRITALAYVPTSGALHFVYFEKYAAAQPGEGLAVAPTGPSPYYKTYGVAHGNGQFLGSFPFGYGDPRTRANFAVHVQGTTDAVFEDQHDSIVVVPRGNQDRVFLAVGDHGYVRVAEVKEENAGGPLLPIAAATPPIPAPIPAINPALVGAVAGALSLSVVGRMAAARNKKAAEAPT